MLPIDIPDHEIIRTLREPGSAKLVLARHVAQDREVVIRFVERPPQIDAATVQQYREVLQTLRRMNQANVETILDADLGDASGYVMTVYLAGGSLAERLARPLSIDQALRIARQMAQGLAAAHKKGIAHGALNPHSIQFDTDDTAVITGFGAAHRLGGPSPPGASIYWAPECSVTRWRPDVRADVYALGILVYEMLAGRKPFDALSPETIRAIKESGRILPLPPQAAHIQPIIERMLAPDPQQRYASARAVFTALTRVIQSHEAQPATERGPAKPVVERAPPTPPPPQDPPPTLAAPVHQPGRYKPVLVGVVVLITLPLVAWLTEQSFRPTASTDGPPPPVSEAPGTHSAPQPIAATTPPTVATFEPTPEPEADTTEPPIPGTPGRLPITPARTPGTEPPPVEPAASPQQLATSTGPRSRPLLRRPGMERSHPVTPSSTPVTEPVPEQPQTAATDDVAPMPPITNPAEPEPPTLSAHESRHEDPRSPILLEPSPNPPDVASGSVPEPASVTASAKPETTDATAPSAPEPFDTHEIRLADGHLAATLVYLPGRTFLIGSPLYEQDRWPNERQHPVEVGDFFIGEHEVTVGQFARFAQATGYKTEAERDDQGCWSWVHRPEGGAWAWDSAQNWRTPGFDQQDSQPVVCVSWNDAMAYVAWLNLETDGGFHLPTEAQWEYAARGGISAKRFWGDGIKATCEHVNAADRNLGRRWDADFRCHDGHWYTAPVGSYAGHPWGLSDMLGNVWEWTCSAWDEDYEGPYRECEPAEAAGSKALRGGAWNSGPRDIRASTRLAGEPDRQLNTVGFRIARAVTAPSH